MLYDRHVNALQRLVRHYTKGFVSFTAFNGSDISVPMDKCLSWLHNIMDLGSSLEWVTCETSHVLLGGLVFS